MLVDSIVCGHLLVTPLPKAGPVSRAGAPKSTQPGHGPQWATGLCCSPVAWPFSDGPSSAFP